VTQQSGEVLFAEVGPDRARLASFDLRDQPATGNAVPSAGAVAGEGVRRAAMHEVAGPVVRILVELVSKVGELAG
jgi:hypothetical protein